MSANKDGAELLAGPLVERWKSFHGAEDDVHGLKYGQRLKCADELLAHLRESGVVERMRNEVLEEAAQIAQGQAAQASKLEQQQEALIALQVETEQQRLVLEGRKQELEAHKLALEARQMDIEAQQAEAEAALRQDELSAQAAQVAQDVRQTEAAIQKIMAEIARTVLQTEAIAEKLGLERAKLRLQAGQISGQLEIQRLQAEAAIQASQQTRREGANNGTAARR